ncbi:MAG: DUF4373 domain-containing protein [Dysgonamonadaceae bacterium]|jgi:hypothetical protein|nr:DUF4373 domain-containing protein [Dysgonamonadaceae bacterium]
MSKKAFYFKHDFNARNDEKISLLRIKHGMLGYGVYFAILERLGEATDYVGVIDYNIIAYDLRVDAFIIKSVINDFGLFAFTEDGECFYSESLIKRMEPLSEKSEKCSEAGARGGGNPNFKKGKPNPYYGKDKGEDKGTFIQDINKENIENKEKPTIVGKKKDAADAISPFSSPEQISNETDLAAPPKEKTWRDSFDIYLDELRVAYREATQNSDWIAEREKYHPGLNILLTLEKACKDYWAKEAGWKRKKACKTAKIDWVRTFNNALTINGNKVWKTKEENDGKGKQRQKEVVVIQS